MIKVERLNKKFSEQSVIKNTSVNFEKNKVTSIIGPNGAGKSTLLSMISRLLEKDSGSICIDGQALEQWATDLLAKKLAVLRQANNVTMRFTVKELISFGRFPHCKGKLTTKDHHVIDNAINYLELTDIQDRYLDNLSGGQRQLAFIAMVMAQDTDYILLDEPLNNLDIKHSLQIMRNIQRLAYEFKKSVIIVIHDINFAASYSDRIIAMKKGEVVIDGTTDEVIDASVLEEIYETPFTVIEQNGKRICTYY
ncbi:MAG: iron complex transport system ATP-binding protein [Psychromonas sp.]|jgi:iron complex transport system ATP-binding protein